MWRYTARPALLAVVDARAAIPLVLCCVWPTWWTLELAVLCMVFFAVIGWLGLSVPAFWRLARRMLAGPVRCAIPSWQRRWLA